MPQGTGPPGSPPSSGCSSAPAVAFHLLLLNLAAVSPRTRRPGELYWAAFARLPRPVQRGLCKAAVGRGRGVGGHRGQGGLWFAQDVQPLPQGRCSPGWAAAQGCGQGRGEGPTADGGVRGACSATVRPAVRPSDPRFCSGFCLLASFLGGEGPPSFLISVHIPSPRACLLPEQEAPRQLSVVPRLLVPVTFWGKNGLSTRPPSLPPSHCRRGLLWPHPSAATVSARGGSATLPVLTTRLSAFPL